ncbi:YkgJ family cysteine cluster protein [Desulfobacula sp.]|uniref:YkgJ family cysteine cluster protein n=1 Tax=Desulfobacula sp. TaxID=2593537 RepID=UPI00341BA525
MKISPCETCGACCAFSLVSFPDFEVDNIINGFVPVDMTSLFKDSRRFMKGTDTRNHRCIALEGKVGFCVKCLIYEHRPSTCREFNISWENNIGNFLCDRSREFFGLQSFSKY